MNKIQKNYATALALLETLKAEENQIEKDYIRLMNLVSSIGNQKKVKMRKQSRITRGLGPFFYLPPPLGFYGKYFPPVLPSVSSDLIVSLSFVKFLAADSALLKLEKALGFRLGPFAYSYILTLYHVICD